MTSHHKKRHDKPQPAPSLTDEDEENVDPQITLEWPAFTGATGVVLAITKDSTPAGLHVIEDGGATEYGPFAAEGHPETVWAGVARPIGSPVDATIKP
jgi:hypothetical protein